MHLLPYFYKHIITINILLFVFGLFQFDNAFGQVQPPAITYATPQTYLLNQSITPLQPINTGGGVPATIYGQVSVIASGFSEPTGVAVDATGNVYGEDWGNVQIKKITPAGNLSVFAGSGSPGSADGVGMSASFYRPDGIIIDNNGNLYVADYFNNSIRKITPAGVVTTIAGGTAGSADGTGSAASFNGPRGLAIDISGNLYLADQTNNKIRKITQTGIVTTIVASGLNSPTGVGFDIAGNLYIADAGSNSIKKMTPAGVITSFATGISFPREIRADGTNNFYVSEQDGNSIKRISPTGIVTTIASNQGGPLGLILDGKGNLYFSADSFGQIRKVIISGYTLDRALPPGLVFDPTTGIISGKPTAITPADNYTITAYNGGGSSTTIVNIEVLLIKPSIITFPPPILVLDANNNYAPAATSTNHETPITYTSSNPLVATVTPNGLIHVLGPGVSIITANQAGNTNYSAAQPVQQTLTVVEYLSVILPPITAKTVCDADFATNATSGNSTLPITYTSSNTNVATISAQGLIHITGVGTSTITAYKNGSLPLYVSATPQSKTLTVTAPVTPGITISPSYASPCAGSMVTFTAAPTNAGTAPSYQWKVNGLDKGTNNSTFSSTTLANGDNVSCIITNNNTPCLATFPITSNVLTVNLVTPSSPTVSIVASTNYVYAGVAITFKASVKNAVNPVDYQWLVNGISSGSKGDTFTSITLANNDVVTCNISSATACTTPSVSNPLTVNIVTQLTIPNTFTPNSDGFNDIWNIVGIANYPDCHVNIYNRYGKLVFQSTGYAHPWDGTSNGGSVPAGTYYYLITDKILPGNLSGSITVIR
jgi:gliding motility-associated-like protein